MSSALRPSPTLAPAELAKVPARAGNPDNGAAGPNVGCPAVQCRENGPCSALDERVRDRDAEAALGVGQALVLAVVAVALGMREDHDAVGGEGRQRVLDRDGGLALAGVAGGVDALLLEPLDGLLLGGLGLARSPRRSRRPRTRPWTGWWRGRRRAPRRPRPRRRARSAAASASTGSGVRTSSFTSKPLPPARRRTNGAAEPAADAQDDDRDVVAQPAALHLERLRPRCAAAIATGVAPVAARRRQRASRSGPKRVVERARLDHAVGVEDERVARARASTRSSADLRVGRRSPAACPARRPSRPRRRRAGSAAAGARPRRRTPSTPSPRGVERGVQHRAEAVVEALAQERLVELREHGARAPACSGRRRAACSGRAR